MPDCPSQFNNASDEFEFEFEFEAAFLSDLAKIQTERLPYRILEHYGLTNTLTDGFVK
jgi:hypothetical protein